MIKSRKKLKYTVWEHLDHTLEYTNYAHRLQWLEQAHQFIETLRKKKNYPNLYRKS